MKLLFEKSVQGRKVSIMPECDVPTIQLSDEMLRQEPLDLPELSENDLSRHYRSLSKMVHGVNDGFYPLGSCTMKYNPKVNDEVASIEGFKDIHPQQPDHTVQGCLKVLKMTEDLLCEITGMDRMTFQPAAGAQGELTGLLLMKSYHEGRGDYKRKKIIVPDSAHGTNPASVTMVGYEMVAIPSNENGGVDINALREAAGPDTAGLMLTNPNTLGLFDENIMEITKIIHENGGLNYYDGANLNAVIGVTRPGDTGFDIVHLNLHKTFSTPHGGGGPGSGPVGCKGFLEKYLPGPMIEKSDVYFTENPEASFGKVKSFYGNFLVVVRALTYILTLGREGMLQVSHQAVLNANYMMEKLKDIYPVAFEGRCMHEFVLSLEKLKKDTGITAMDIAKGLLDYNIHPPTMYFPLIVHEALMVEPTETESKETLDMAISVFKALHEKALHDPDTLKKAPMKTPVGRVDEITAARKPILRYTKG